MNTDASHGTKVKFTTGLTYLGIAGIIIVFLFPLYWLIITSFKVLSDVTLLPPRFIPFLQFAPTLDNYKAILFSESSASGTNLTAFPQSLLNSILICGAATVVAVMLGTLAAYTFSRFKVKGESDLLFFILSTRMLPPIVVIVPIFLMFTQLSLRNSFAGITLMYLTAGLPFVVWMMKGFFDEIPREYEDAAMVDGYSRLEAIWKIVLPEAFPAMLATAVFVLITAWNDFVFVQMLNPESWSTVPVFLYKVIGYGRVEWSKMAATSVIFLVPIVVFTFLVRNHMLRGVTFGAVRR
ncbi:MAG: carbohydrate ABC transporter permease [Anaerolineaceae bacterium]|nr:carbohydrate ABC transporter permease [Anaerolineaceae bacterium]